MPVKQCREGGRPGYKWGEAGKCYTYRPGDVEGRIAAKRKAERQGKAVEAGKRDDGGE